jgi:hypothetical protein
MPKAAEDALKREANKHKGWSKERKNAFVYGILRHKFHWKPSRERK